MYNKEKPLHNDPFDWPYSFASIDEMKNDAFHIGTLNNVVNVYIIKGALDSFSPRASASGAAR